MSKYDAAWYDGFRAYNPDKNPNDVNPYGDFKQRSAFSEGWYAAESEYLEMTEDLYYEESRYADY